MSLVGFFFKGLVVGLLEGFFVGMRVGVKVSRLVGLREGALVGVPLRDMKGGFDGAEGGRAVGF